MWKTDGFPRKVICKGLFSTSMFLYRKVQHHLSMVKNLHRYSITYQWWRIFTYHYRWFDEDLWYDNSGYIWFMGISNENRTVYTIIYTDGCRTWCMGNVDQKPLPCRQADAQGQSHDLRKARVDPATCGGFGLKLLAFAGLQNGSKCVQRAVAKDLARWTLWGSPKSLKMLKQTTIVCVYTI